MSSQAGEDSHERDHSGWGLIAFPYTGTATLGGLLLMGLGLADLVSAMLETVAAIRIRRRLA